jgi:hypothetical protein
MSSRKSPEDKLPAAIPTAVVSKHPFNIERLVSRGGDVCLEASLTEEAWRNELSELLN